MLITSNMRAIQSPNFVLLWTLILVASSFIHAKSSNTSTNCMEKERQTLLAIRRSIVDESKFLGSWSNASQRCCEWRGVTCDEQTRHVIGLNLSRNSFDSGSGEYLSGNISLSALIDLQYLRVLDLRENGFEGSEIPRELGTLSNLQTLSLSRNDFSVPDLDWLSGLSSLRLLDLSGLNLSQVPDWPKYISELPSLQELFLGQCQLPSVIPSKDYIANFSKSLKVLDLSVNDFGTSIFQWVSDISTDNLVDLQLSWCELQGQIPDVTGNLGALKFLDLSGNRLTGGIPKYFRNLCSLESLFLQENSFSDLLEISIEHLSCSKETLKSLDLSDNPFTGQFPNFTGFSSLVELKIHDSNVGGSLSNNLDHLSKLKTVKLSYNVLTGSIPSLTRLSSLRSLDLSNNLLNGSIAESFGLLSSLQVLDLHNNSLNGVLTEKQFSNLSSLRVLNFDGNSLTLSLSSNWIPPFQLEEVYISFCKVGPNFPSWLFINQTKLEQLSVSHASIEDSFPLFFKNLSSPLKSLDLSFNQIHGQLPDLSSNKHLSGEIDLSSNQISGPLPQFPPNVESMTLSRNMFSGSASSLCPTIRSKLRELMISDNKLSGELPDCWTKFKQLMILNLENNQFSGKLPATLGSTEILFLILRNNNFSGGISSLRKARNLGHLDLGDNNLSGELPEWFGETLEDLRVLRLRSNRFNGKIPTSLCGLTSLQVLDLSRNNLSGVLPSCLSNMTGMTRNAFSEYRFPDSISLTWKGKEAEFEENIGLMMSFDISKNNLTGEIPESITSLLKLKSLNLSRNNLAGRIPANISLLEDLEALDLSMNQLSGHIPTGLSSLHFLDNLNLSYNKLTGKIPLGPQMQTFEASCYIGNDELFGPPLTEDFPVSNATYDRSDVHSHSKENVGDEYVTVGFYVSIVIGFVVGFLGIFGSLIFKRSWRYAYFEFWNKIGDWFYVKKRLYKAKLRRRFVTSANF